MSSTAKYLPIGKFLSYARLKVGLTQKEVADALGYSTAQFISNWERGIAQPPDEALPILVKLYSLKSFVLIDLLVKFDMDQARKRGAHLKALLSGKGKKKRPALKKSA